MTRMVFLTIEIITYWKWNIATDHELYLTVKNSGIKKVTYIQYKSLTADIVDLCKIIYLDKERHSIYRKLKSDNRDTFPTIETRFCWWRSFSIKFSTLISRARPWKMDSVMFLKWPTHGCCHSARRAMARSCTIQKWIEGILLVDFSTPS